MDKADVSHVEAILGDYLGKGEQLAIDALKGGKFSSDAFLVLSMAHFLRKEADPLPDSEIDERVDVSKDYLVIYMKDKTADHLRAYMTQVRQILSELYHESAGECRAVMAEEIKKMGIIINH